MEIGQAYKGVYRCNKGIYLHKMETKKICYCVVFLPIFRAFTVNTFIYDHVSMCNGMVSIPIIVYTVLWITFYLLFKINTTFCKVQAETTSRTR